MNKRLLTAIAFILILSGGIFLRFRDLGAQSYWMDEGYTINAVISGLKNGTDHFASILDSGVRYGCATYCLPTMAIVRVAGKTPQGYRFLAGLCGILVVMVVFGFTGALGREGVRACPDDAPTPPSASLGTGLRPYAPLIAAIFISFSSFQIAWSRQARWYTMLELFFWLSLFCFFLFLEHRAQGAGHRGKMWIFLGLAGVFALLAIATQPLALLLPVVAFVWYVIERRPKRKEMAIVAVAAITFLVFVELIVSRGFIISNRARSDAAE